MLISYDQITSILSSHGITITGALHVGAHECEELPFYHQLGLTNNDIVWMDAMNNKVMEAKNRGIPNVYHAVVTDKDDDTVMFNVSNNGQSSSVLEFGTHSQEHPHVVYVDKVPEKTVTLNSFFKRNNMDGTKYTFWNFDIQGAELMALKGATDYLPYAKTLYLEVNEKELYKNCGMIGEIDEFLSQYHFKRVLTSMTQHGWGDALYILDSQ